MGVDVGLGGTGLGVKVGVLVAVGGATVIVWVGGISVAEEQAESPKYSAKHAKKRIA
jgi:hypothetical protein